jgi:iron(III) transport system substrate-binding protein
MRYAFHCIAIVIAGLVMTSVGARAGSYTFPGRDSAAGVGSIGQPANSGRAVVYSTTDINAARPIIAGFQQRYPEITIEYHDLQSIDIYERVIAESDGAGGTADMVLSSAMDLQVKLVNDGYAQQWPATDAGALPSWAVWRNAAFGLTFEPAVIVYHKPSFIDRDPPKTRADLKKLLAQDGGLTGKVATYDIERSGIGFLFLARDQEHSRDIWDLVSLMGLRKVKLYSTSAAIIDRVANGRLLIGYNVLGSYAERMAQTRPDLAIAEPNEYTIILSRVALIPRAARRSDLGRLFLDFLLSVDGQRILATEAGLNPIRLEMEVNAGHPSLRQRLGPRARPIRVGPGLLVYMDQAKRRQVLELWNRALVDQ